MIALWMLLVCLFPIDAPEPEPAPGDCIAWECRGESNGRWVDCSCVAHEGSIEL